MIMVLFKRKIYGLFLYVRFILTVFIESLKSFMVCEEQNNKKKIYLKKTTEPRQIIYTFSTMPFSFGCEKLA